MIGSDRHTWKCNAIDPASSLGQVQRQLRCSFHSMWKSNIQFPSVLFEAVALLWQCFEQSPNLHEKFCSVLCLIMLRDFWEIALISSNIIRNGRATILHLEYITLPDAQTFVKWPTTTLIGKAREWGIIFIKILTSRKIKMSVSPQLSCSVSSPDGRQTYRTQFRKVLAPAERLWGLWFTDTVANGN